MALYVYLAICCLLVGIPAIAGDDDEGMAACVAFFQPENRKEMCCETMHHLHGMGKQGHECIKKDEEYTCDVAKCMYEAEDLTDGGELSEEKIKAKMEEVEKNSEDAKTMMDAVKEKCLNKKYLDTPPKEACPFIKMQICMYTHMMTSCPKWKDTDNCKKMAENAEKCKTAMDSKE